MANPYSDFGNTDVKRADLLRLNLHCFCMNYVM